MAIAAAASTPARAEVFLTRDQALIAAFPGARIERREFALGVDEVQVVQQRARVKLSSRLAPVYLAWRGDTLDGTAFFDMRTVRTMPAVFMVVVAPDTTVRRVEVLAFHEPPDYRPPDRWLTTWDGRALSDRLWPHRDLRNLSGATLTARSVTESVRQSLALYELIVAPALTRSIADSGSVRTAPPGGESR
jgi:hypothetical protein